MYCVELVSSFSPTKHNLNNTAADITIVRSDQNFDPSAFRCMKLADTAGKLFTNTTALISHTFGISHYLDYNDKSSELWRKLRKLFYYNCNNKPDRKVPLEQYPCHITVLLFKLK
jgi:hypothetical protein